MLFAAAAMAALYGAGIGAGIGVGLLAIVGNLPAEANLPFRRLRFAPLSGFATVVFAALLAAPLSL